MEAFCVKFFHLAENIFGQLDNQSLTKCRLVSKNWQDYIDNQCQKMLQIRNITVTINNFHEVGNSWRRVFHTATTQTILDLGDAVGKFYNVHMERSLNTDKICNPKYSGGQLRIIKTHFM